MNSPTEKRYVHLRVDRPLVIKSRSKSGEKTLKVGQWWIDKNTEVGEDADIYERKPYGGNRLINRAEILRNE